MRVLLVEDDVAFGAALKTALARERIDVDWVTDGVHAWSAFQGSEHDLLLVDLGLPGLSGLDLLHRVRHVDPQRPFVVLTARGELDDRVRGLDFGADDYLVKPFEFAELMARLRSLTRRTRSAAESTLAIGPVELDLQRHGARVDGEAIWLTGREYAVLRLLMERADQAVSRQAIESQLDGFGDDAGANVIEVHIHNLRRKLGRERIQTYRGSGYVFPRRP